VSTATIRNRIEKWFEKFSLTIFRFRWATILIVLVLVGLLASWVPKITFDTSNESFLHKNSPTLMDYNAFRDQFGRDDLIIIAIGPTDVFSLSFLEKLKIFHENLRDDVPHVEEITSLINARNTRGENDALIVGDLLEDWPGNQDQVETLKKRVMSNPLYLNRLISENAQFTTLVIKTETYSNTNALDDPLAGFDENDDSFADDDTSGTLQGAAEKQSPADNIQYLTDEEISETVYHVKSIAKKYQDENFEIYIAGPPVVGGCNKKV
jgi:predicted RND superfamily exporter protein